jgi:hypothetical protein
LFHAARLFVVVLATDWALGDKLFDKKCGKEAVSLRKALILSDYTEGSFNAAVRDIERLRDLHRQIDEAVLSAYGWTDVRLGHGFHEVDFLPETDRTRYTIAPEARKALLQRLLELNHERHEEELEAALSFDAVFQSAKANKLGNQISFDF